MTFSYTYIIYFDLYVYVYMYTLHVYYVALSHPPSIPSDPLLLPK